MALEELAAPGSCEDSYEIAGHYRQAARWTLAVPHQLRAARREIDEGSLETAEPQPKRALTDIAALPPGEERRRLEIATQIAATCHAHVTAASCRHHQRLLIPSTGHDPASTQ